MASDLIIRFGLRAPDEALHWLDFLSKCVLGGIGSSTGRRLAR